MFSFKQQARTLCLIFMNRFSWQNVLLKPQTACSTGHFGWSPLTFLHAGQEWRWQCPAARLVLPWDLSVILQVRKCWTSLLGAISGGLGAQGQSYIQLLTCNVPHGRYGFMDTCHGRLRDVCVAAPPANLFPSTLGHFVETPQHIASTCCRGVAAA